MSPSVIGISGARSLSTAQLAQVSGLAASVARSGGIIYTGCALGADAAAITGAGQAAHVYAVGNAQGAGFPRAGIPQHLALAWVNSHITWLAGGPLSLPLVARLARRSLAMVRAVATTGGSLVAFPAGPCPPRAFTTGSGAWWSCGSGTWSTVAAAALLGVQIFVALPEAPSPGLPVAGTWRPSSLYGVAGWAFVPATGKMF